MAPNTPFGQSKQLTLHLRGVEGLHNVNGDSSELSASLRIATTSLPASAGMEGVTTASADDIHRSGEPIAQIEQSLECDGENHQGCSHHQPGRSSKKTRGQEQWHVCHDEASGCLW